MARSLAKSGFPSFLMDPYRPTAAEVDGPFRLRVDRMLWGAPLLVGVFALAAALVGWIIEPGRFYFAYLTAWSFCLSISLGALFFVMAHHITRAHWGIVVRRVAESLALAFPVLALASIPILFGMHDLYHWTHEDLYDPEDPGYDAILAGKRGYLNTPFFLIRLALYFIIWSVLAYRLWQLSIRQDFDPDRDIPAKQRKVSAIGIPLYAVTVAFASYDLLMSLYPHWFSTMYGVYFFAGCFWSAVAMIILVVALLQRTGSGLQGVVTAEHYHDLGKWLFAFTIFWAYVAFSQYMLIWYANLPEETVWYRYRVESGWGWHSAMLIIFHFAVPFAVLLPRASKRILPILSVMAVLALVMHWFDLHWNALPNYHPPTHEAAVPVLDHTAGVNAPMAHPAQASEAALDLDMPHETASTFHWIDFACWFGLFGLYVGLAFYRIARHGAVPRNDPRLGLSLHFHNA